MNQTELKSQLIQNIDNKLQLTYDLTHQIIDAVTDINTCTQEILFCKNLLSEVEKSEQK